MTNEQNEARKSNPRVRELKNKICDKDGEKCYVFISYKSDDWEIVLTEIVYKLVNEYGLNVYYDGSFDLHNNSWVEQMPENMNSYKCKGILAFLDDKYATSYATLMELMHSQTYDGGGNSGLPVIPVNLDDLHDIKEINPKLGDENTGLGVEVYSDGTKNNNYMAERNLFENDYDEIDYIFEMANSNGVSKKKIYRKGEVFKKVKCSEMVNRLLASKGYNTNMYSPSEAFYSSLVKKIKSTCGSEVFSVIDKNIAATQTIPVTVENVAPAEKPVQEAAKPQTAPEPDAPTPGGEQAKTKSATSTGDITYTIYGREYTHNQANMMLNVFAKVLQKHPDAVGKILADPEKPLIRCVSRVNYELPENKTDPMPSRYNAGCYFDIGGGIFVGTSLNYPEKLRNISQLLTICGEDFSILRSDQIELPSSVKTKASGSGDEVYSIYGEQRSGNQTQMMVDVLKFLVEKHFDKREKLAELLAINLAPMSELSDSTYFRTGNEFSYNGVTYSIGTSFGRQDKLKQIIKAVKICGEDIAQFQIEGLDAAKPASRKKKTANEFLNS